MGWVLIGGTSNLSFGHFGSIDCVAVHFLYPLFQCADIALSGVEPSEYLTKLYFIFWEYEDDVYDVFLFDYVIEFSIFFVFHPHAAFALI
jgi:hypothetical protein